MRLRHRPGCGHEIGLDCQHTHTDHESHEQVCFRNVPETGASWLVKFARARPAKHMHLPTEVCAILGAGLLLQQLGVLLQTCKESAGLWLPCISPRPILQLPEETTERCIDICSAFDARPQKPRSWAHTQWHHGHNPWGVIVQLGSQSRQSVFFFVACADQCHRNGRRDTVPTSSGAAETKMCDLAAWVHSVLVAAANGLGPNSGIALVGAGEVVRTC